MANIKTYLNNIKTAVFGHEVRGSIHDGIEAINNEVEDTTSRQYVLENTFEELTINSGNSNAEIVAARVEADGTTHKKLGDRLDNFDSQIKDITNKIDTIHYDGVIIGDSLSKGDDGQSYKGHANIKDWLQYFTRQNIVDNGIWGDCLDGITSRFKTDVLDYNPSWCLILVGTNDLTNGMGTNAMVTKARKLIEILKKNNITPIMVSIPPRNDKKEYNVKIREYNSKLQYICEKLGAKYADVYSELCTVNGDAKEYILRTSDNLHWTSYGACECAKSIFNQCFSDLKINQPTLCRLWSDNIYDNFEIAQFDDYNGGKLAHYYTAIDSGNCATFSKEKRTDVTRVSSNYECNYQVIEKPSTETKQMAGISYDPGAYIIGATYRTELDFDFEITDHTDDNDTAFVCCLTVWHTDGTATQYHKFIEAYALQRGKATIFFDLLIPVTKRKMKLEIYGYGKSGFRLKTGMFNAHPLG